MNARMQPVERVSDTTLRFPRTLRETEKDPMAWWTNAEAEIANETFIRAMFAEPVKPVTEPRSVVWAHRCIYLIAACVLGWVVVDFFLRRG